MPIAIAVALMVEARVLGVAFRVVAPSCVGTQCALSAYLSFWRPRESRALPADPISRIERWSRLAIPDDSWRDAEVIVAYANCLRACGRGAGGASIANCSCWLFRERPQDWPPYSAPRIITRKCAGGRYGRAREAKQVRQTELENEVASLITEAVNLEVAPQTLDPDVHLFGEGLGLDSIDLLEVALAVSRKYGFQLRSDDPDNERIFSSLRALSAHVARHRTR